MEFKELNQTEVTAFSSLLGEAEHGFFDPGESSHNAWARDMVTRYFGRGVSFWGYLVAGRPVGVVGLLVDKQPNGQWREFGQITHIGVMQDQRHHGYGSALLHQAETVAASLGVKILDVQTSTQTAPFYEHSGFVIDAKRNFGGIVQSAVHLYKDLRTQSKERPTKV
jgi:GNAT superfamily N-acetyltransferase